MDPFLASPVYRAAAATTPPNALKNKVNVELEEGGEC